MSHRVKHVDARTFFLLVNVLWVAWGLPFHAYALVAMQVCLAFMNIRGWKKNSR